MQSQLKLFYRPKAIIRSSSDQPERKLTAERNAGHLTLRNPTPYYITVAWLGADRSHRLSGFREGVMVPPREPAFKGCSAGRNPDAVGGVY